MKQEIKEFIKICSECLPIQETILEIGSLQVKGQEGFADLRPIFPNKRYIGADMREGAGVDILLDLHKINMGSESINTVIVAETLEHTENPIQALKECYRILEKDGIIIITSAMDVPIHNHPSDYWRFTPAGFEYLLKDFKTVFVGYAGKENFPHTVVGIGIKTKEIGNTVCSNFVNKYLKWQKKYKVIKTIKPSLWREILKSIMPKSLLDFYRKVRDVRIGNSKK